MNKLKPNMKKTSLNILICLIFMCVGIGLYSIDASCAPSLEASSNTGVRTALSGFFKEYKLVLNTFVAIAVLTNFLIFIYHFCKLAALSADHPLIRRQTVHNLLISGVCLALIGGGGLVYYIVLSIVLG